MQRIFTNFALIIVFSLVFMNPSTSVSLLGSGGVRQNTLNSGPRGFYDPYVARTVGDVITVRVTENVEALKSAEVLLDNDTRTDADLLLQIAMTTTSTLTPDTNDVANMLTNFALPVDFSRRNSREVSINNREEFFTLVSCLVVEKDPESGNMVVEGSRQILMEGQTKSLYVRGIVMPKDLDSNNEVPSYKLANAQVQIIGSGALTKDRDSGVLQRIFRKLF